jgi:GH15 family glucan-1,4-alpha-glucosidase
MLTESAEKMKKAMLERLYDRDLGRFVRAVYPDGSRDNTPDCSTAFAFLYGPFGARDESVVKTMDSLKQHLWIRTPVGGMARYVNDDYARVSTDVPGNPWPICSLWLGRWHIALATNLQELKQGMDIISWATHAALPSGVLAEQINPYSGAPVGVSPLAWSHAEYLMAVCEYLEKHRLLLTEQAQ